MRRADSSPFASSPHSARGARWWNRPATSHQPHSRSPLKERPAPEIVDQVHHADLHSGPGHPDRAHQPPAVLGLFSEHVLDSRLHLRTLAVRCLGLYVQRTPRGPLAVDVTAEPGHLQNRHELPGAVGRVGPDVAAGTTPVEHLVEHLAVVHRGDRDLPLSDQLVLPVHGDMVLVTIVVLPDLLRPGLLDVLLGHHLMAPRRRDITSLDLGVLAAGVALPRRRDQHRIVDLPAPRLESADLDLGTDFLKHRLDGLRPGQVLTEKPQGARVEHPRLRGQAKKALNRQPIAHFVLGLLVGQVVEVLQHQDLEHKHHVGALAPSGRLALRARACDLDRRPEACSIHQLIQPRQRTAQLVQLIQPVMQGEETWLHHRGRPAASVSNGACDFRMVRSV